MNKLIEKLEFRTTVLLIGLVVVWAVAYIVNIITIRKYNEALIENARLEQQVIDYRWQLEQVTYILGE